MWDKNIRNHKKARNIINKLKCSSRVNRFINRLIYKKLISGLDVSCLNLLRNETHSEYLINMLEKLLEEKC